MSASVQQLFGDFWTWRLDESPEMASFCGNFDHDHRLDDVSQEGYERRGKAAEVFLARCTDVLGQGDLSKGDCRNVSLLAEDLRLFLAGLKYQGYLFPVSYAEGIHIDFELFTTWMDFSTVAAFNKYVSRLKALPKRLQQVQQLLSGAVAQGLTYHQLSMKGVKEEFEYLEKSPEETVFFKPFKSASAELELESAKKEALVTIEKEIQPAYMKLKNYVLTEYVKHLRPSEGVSCLPDGRCLYEACLFLHLSVKMSPENIHQRGIEEVARIKNQMLRVIDKTGFKGAFKDFLSELRSNEDFYFKDKESLLQGYKDLCQNVIRPKLSDLFYNIPKTAMILEPIPESRPNAPPGYYFAGTLDGSRPGTFYFNANLKECPKYKMVALSLHEGEPGHHFQNMYAREMKGFPMFRQYIEDMNYYAVPSRFPLHTAYIEGWGLYCEYLGEEMGLYEDPYTMFGRLSFEMHRACRLVVDTGIHAFGWTFDQAKAHLKENTAQSEATIENEVRRYMTWPGQACAYKIGELKIKELRKLATDKLGAKFDVRDFHEVVLGAGLVPLHVLEEDVNSYIEQKLS